MDCYFHDTGFVLTELQDVHPQLPDEVRGIADDIIATLPPLIIANEPQQLIHGDLKISNLIFDDLGHAVGIIDYAQGFGLPSIPETRARHLRATRHIALELTARFLIDVVHDAYFGFDAVRYPHRRAHNVARARGQYHLAQTIPYPCARSQDGPVICSVP